MPLLLNRNPNPQAVMLGRQHLRKLMLGGDVVWQKHRRKPLADDLSLETLEHRGVKLRATNQNGNLSFPMFFPPSLRSDWAEYQDRLTFISETELSLQSIDAMLEADVVGLEMLFPMFFFDHTPTHDFDFRGKLTFIGNEALALGLSSMDELLIAEVHHDRDMIFPMAFPVNRPTSRLEFLDRLTFMAKEGAEIDDDFIQDFDVNAYCPDTDYIQDFDIETGITIDYNQVFEINGYDPAKDYIQDFGIESELAFWEDFEINAYNPDSDSLQDFEVNAYNPDTDFIKDFDSNACDPAKDFYKDCSVHAYDPAKDFIKDFSVAVTDPTKDFIKTFTLPVIQTKDFSKTFTIPAIRTVDYTKNFTISAIRTIDYTKNFNLQALVMKDFTKNFTISASAGGDIVVVWVETTSTINLRAVSGCTTYFVVPFMYMGTPVTRTYSAILTAVRHQHGASLTGSEMTVHAPNTDISVPGAKYVVFVPQINAQSVTIIGTVVHCVECSRLYLDSRFWQRQRKEN